MVSLNIAALCSTKMSLIPKCLIKSWYHFPFCLSMRDKAYCFGLKKPVSDPTSNKLRLYTSSRSRTRAEGRKEALEGRAGFSLPGTPATQLTPHPQQKKNEMGVPSRRTNQNLFHWLSIYLGRGLTDFPEWNERSWVTEERRERWGSRRGGRQAQESSTHSLER